MVALNKTYRKPHTPDRSAKDSGHRFYSPEISRWLNRDPQETKKRENEYIFVRNSALQYFDALGSDAEPVAAPSLDFTLAVNPGTPVPRLCGEVSYTRRWQVGGNGDFAEVGWVVQALTMVWKIYDCKTRMQINIPTERVQYWEAFEATSANQWQQDDWLGKDEGETYGWGYFFGSAFYHNGNLPFATNPNGTHANTPSAETPWLYEGMGSAPVGWEEDPPWGDLSHMHPYTPSPGPGVTQDSNKIRGIMWVFWNCCCGKTASDVDVSDPL